MRTVTIKLINGEEWIGQEVELIGSPNLTLERVRKLQIVPSPKGGPGLALMPILMGNVDADRVTINLNHVIIKLEVSPDFERQYLQEVTGIQLS